MTGTFTPGPAECAFRHDAIIAQCCLTILGKPVPGSGAQGAGTPRMFE